MHCFSSFEGNRRHCLRKAAPWVAAVLVMSAGITAIALAVILAISPMLLAAAGGSLLFLAPAGAMALAVVVIAVFLCLKRPETNSQDIENNSLFSSSSESESNSLAIFPENHLHVGMWLKTPIIKLYAKDLIKYSEKCLKEFCQFLFENHNFMFNFRVKFLRESGARQEEEGLDDGGLKRQFVSDLATGLTKLDYFGSHGSLFVPQARGGQEQSGWPRLSDGELDFFQNLGVLFYFSYASDQVKTGRMVHDAMFYAMRALTPEELAKKEMSHKTAVKLAGHLLKAWIDLGMAVDADKILLKGLKKASQARKYLVLAEFDTDEIETDTCLQVFRLLIGDKNRFGHIALQLEPILAITKGFYNAGFKGQGGHFLEKWNDKIHVSGVRRIKAGALSAKIQGPYTDKQAILDALKIKYNYFQQANDFQTLQKKDIVSFMKDRYPFFLNQYNWLRLWIEQEATDDDLKAFLRFMTGATHLHSPSQELFVQTHNKNMALPIANTCSCILKLPKHPRYVCANGNRSNSSYEGFVQCLKEAIFYTTDFGLA